MSSDLWSPRGPDDWWGTDKDGKNRLDNASDGTGGANAAFTAVNGGRQIWNNLMSTDGAGIPNGSFTGNDALRPLGMNYDPPPTSDIPPAPVGESANPAVGLSPEDEEAWFNGASNPAAVEAGQEGEALYNEAAEAGAVDNLFGEVGGVAGVIGGGMQFASGAARAFKDGAKEQDEFHGGLDMLGGAAGVVGGGLGAAGAGLLGAGVATAAAPVAAVAAPIAAAVGLGVAGDHRVEDMHLFGKDADGNYQGAVEAAWNEGMHLGDETSAALGGGFWGDAAGAGVAGVSTVGMELGAGALDVGMGIESLGASSGLFGTAKNADGIGTHNRGAFEALDDVGSAAGDGVDDLLHLDHDSLAGEVVGGGVHALTDIAGSGLAAVGEVGGAVVGGVEAAGSWLADLF